MAPAVSAETVARMGSYGGIAHSALAASDVTMQSIASRMGLGVIGLSAEHVAANGQGATLWLNPVYRNYSSSGMANEGSGYGLDLDLTGVALCSNSSGLGSAPAQGQWRLGALFNVGSGTVDGTGAGAAIDNDFEYWDLGAYTAYQAGNLTLVGELSYTAVDNDLSGMTNLGSVSATS